MKSLIFKLNGKGGAPVDLEDFSVFSTALQEVLRRTYRSIEPTANLPRYKIQKLEIGSAICECGSDTSGEVVFDNVLEAVQAIRHKNTPRFKFTSNDLRAYKKLTGPLASYTESIELSDVPIDQAYREGCEWLLANAPHSVGQSIGRLEGVNIHKQKFFRIYPEGIDRGAECYYPESLHSKVLSSIGKRVCVEGLVHRDPDGIGLDRITKIKEITVLPENDEVPSLMRLFGLFQEQPVDVAAGWGE